MSSKGEIKSIKKALIKKGYSKESLKILNDVSLYKLAQQENIDMVLVCGW